MKFSVEKNIFEEQLNIVSRAINNKTALPVLSNVLLKVEGNSLYLTTTNLEIAIETSIAVVNPQDGETTVPVKLLQNYVTLLPNGNLDIDIENDSLTLSSNKSKTQIKCIPATEFPIIPKSPEEVTFSLHQKEIQKIFTQTVFAAAIDGRRPILAGVFFQLKTQKLSVVATDSYRLAEKIVDVDGDQNCSVIIPSHTILELIRIISKIEDGDMVFKVSKNQIIFNVGNIFLTSRLIEGVYPDYKKIIPEQTETKASIPVNEFIITLKRANLFAKEASGGVKILLQNKGVEVISDTAQTGTENGFCECEVVGPEKTISFNAEYIIDALSNMDGDVAELGVNDPLTPGVLKNPKDTTYTHIVMPLKI